MHKASLICVVTVLIIVLSPAAAQDTSSALPIHLTDASGAEVTIESLDRIVSGSGDVTEIITALGFYDHLVAVDRTSTYPPEALEELPDVGFARGLSAEPIIAMNPTVFFCTQICSPESVFEQLRQVGIPVVIVPDSESGGLELPFPKIEMVAQALGVPERGAALSERVRREIDWSQTAIANVSQQPTVFHFYIRGEGLQLAVGANTPGDAMITAAGAINAGASAGVDGYQALSAEIILTAFPDYLLLTEGNVESMGGLEAVLDAVPSLRATPAVQYNQIIIMDTEYLVGMSIRTGRAALDLAAQLHPDMTWEREIRYPYRYTDATGAEITIEGVGTVFASNNALLETVRRLGFHAEGLDSLRETDHPLVIAAQSDEWQPLRERGIPVIVLADDAEIPEIAAALNVAGRGAALLARLAHE